MSEYIISIDVGIKNLGFAVLEASSNNLVVWKRVNLVTSNTYQPFMNVEYICYARFAENAFV